MRKVLLNILEDFNAEKGTLRDLQAAMLNILEDIEEERIRLGQAKEALEAANRELEAFSYSVSHDLQAPLRAVNGYSRALLEDYGLLLDEQGKHYLQMIEKYAGKMGQLIQDLLAFSRLGRRQVSESNINMGDLAKEVFLELVPEPSDRDIRFLLDPLPPAKGDRAMIRQVFVNLLSNALKFTRARPTAEIFVGYSDSDGETVYSVRDNGVGFDMKYYGKMFKIFERLHSENEFEGTGVGLALVSRIITQHKGRIWADSDGNHGAAFYFTLNELVRPSIP
jgi:light-regulated signal transduction histidine kinase (bacteriophytochrome)